jgi:DNA-binding transcriptional LysR family regulator
MSDWENLRYFLAVARTGTLSGAARALEVDHATVSRRLASLEAAMNTKLVERSPRACRLTAIGQAVFDMTISMEETAFAIERAVHATQFPLQGKVTVTAPPVLVSSFLARHLAQFRASYPGVQLSVSGEARQVSLSRREADLALRLVRPVEASSVIRKLGTMPFALYASTAYGALAQPSNWEFIAYDEQFDELPQQQWLRRIAGERAIACMVGDIYGQYAAARMGAGVAGLPCFIGETDTALRRLDHAGEHFARDIWLVVHEDLKRSATIRAVIDFLVSIFELEPAFSGS